MEFHKTFSKFASEYAGLTRDEFVARFPFPILLIDLEGIVDVPESIREKTSIPPKGALTQFTPGHDEKMQNIIAAPLMKSGRNEIRDSVTIGRADTNDIVLPHGCVSKLHAFFKKDPSSGKIAVTDASSKFGTAVDDKILPPGEPFVLSSKSRIVFAKFVECIYYFPKDFYAQMHLMLHLEKGKTGQLPPPPPNPGIPPCKP